LQRCREVDLALESLGADRGRDLLAKHLDDDFSSEARLSREKDARHAAACKLAFDDKRAIEGGLELFAQGRHQRHPRRRTDANVERPR
jgi:hypothetical protein